MQKSAVGGGTGYNSIIAGAGTIRLGANNALADTSPVSIGSATLDAATFGDTMGTLDATGAATINLGTGAKLAFAHSSAVNWTGGTLKLTGTFVSGGPNGSLGFTKRPGTSGLTYAIQESTDLGVTYPWAEVPPGPSYTNDATTISCTLTPASRRKTSCASRSPPTERPNPASPRNAL